jgi:nucleoside-diphosphate-sugar epimerase
VPQLLEAGHEVTAMTRSVLRAAQLEAAEALPPPYAPEMSMHRASNGKAKRELGWRPRYPSRREGFAASLQS